MATGAQPESSPPARCRLCEQRPTGSYFWVGGGVFCAPCKDRVLADKPSLKVYLRAAALAFAAGLAAAVVDIGVTAASGSQFAIIAILMGWAVGWGMKKGSGGRGGRKFQFLAASLVYCVISLSLLGQILYGVLYAGPDSEVYTPLAGPRLVVPGSPPATPGPEASPALEASPSPVVEVEESPTLAPAEEGSELQAQPLEERGFHPLVTFVLVMLVSLALPVIMASYAPLSILFYCLALYQAWVMTGALPVEGPIALESELPATEEGQQASPGPEPLP